MVLNSRYSQHARRSLSQARLLAQGCQHGVLDTDHLLVGILREKGSLGCQVLIDLGADVQRAEQEIRGLHAVVDPQSASFGSTDALRRVLVLSDEESRWFGHHYVGTEHLLLALARSREGGASDLLRILAISSDQIRRRVRLLLNDGVTEISIEAAKRTARLSELLRRVLNAAGQLASQCGIYSAGPAHLLLVLAWERRSMASRLLQTCGLDQVRLESLVYRVTVEDRLNQETSLEDIIDQAVDWANQLGNHYTGTEHILLALAQDTCGAQLLRQAGVDLAQLTAAIYEHLSR